MTYKIPRLTKKASIEYRKRDFAFFIENNATLFINPEKSEMKRIVAGYVTDFTGQKTTPGTD